MSVDPCTAFREIARRDVEADRVLADTVSMLAGIEGVSWAGIAFLDGGELVLGPAAGVTDDRRRTRAAIVYDGAAVGELRIDGEIEDDVLAELAALLSPYVLIGWDTGGEPWEP